MFSLPVLAALAVVVGAAAPGNASESKHAEALPFYAQAAEKTYGVNKLRIAELGWEDN